MSALALDRQAIEKKDFPISRRGYEPEAVDHHLAMLAGEVDRLQGELDRAARPGSAPSAQPGRGTGSLALAASQQVQMIVEAAENSAADIERSAQEDAARIRSDADAEARRTRESAVSRSEEHVGNVGEATSTMLTRVDAMEQELAALVDSLRTGTNRLTADLAHLQGNLGDLYGAAGSTQTAEPAPAEVSVAPPTTEVLDLTVVPEPPAVAPEPSAVAPEPSAEEPEPDTVAPEAEPSTTDPASEGRAGSGDMEGARLIALNMALNGQSRDETDAYLADNFELDDRGGLLDEVYATVEG